MAVTISSTNRIALVSGSDVQFDPPMDATLSITTDDIYDPENPAQTLTDVLETMTDVKAVSSTLIDATVSGNVSLYTVPNGHAFIPMQILFVLIGIAGSGTAPAINVGYTGSFRQYFDSDRAPGLFDGLSIPGQIVPVADLSATAGQGGANFRYLNGGAVMTARVDSPATYSTFMLRVLVFGFETGDIDMPPPTAPVSLFGRGAYGRDLYGKA